MITIHHLENSRSQRVLWLLEELGLPYEIRRYERLKSLQAPPELKAVHPLGKSPVLTEGELTLAETGAIVTYIIETHGEGRLAPERSSPAYWDYQHFLHYAEGSAMPPLLLKLIFARLPKEAPFFAKPILDGTAKAVNERLIDPQLETHFNHWERSLDRSGWFAGENFSAADIMMSFPLEAARSRGGFGQRVNIPAFLQRIQARPAYRAALARGGPYAFAEER